MKRPRPSRRTGHSSGPGRWAGWLARRCWCRARAAIVEEQRRARPVAQGVADRLGQAGLARDPLELGREPGCQVIDESVGSAPAGPHIARRRRGRGSRPRWRRARRSGAAPLRRKASRSPGGSQRTAVGNGPSRRRAGSAPAAGSSSRLLKPPVAVGLQDALEAGQVGGGVLALAVPA